MPTYPKQRGLQQMQERIPIQVQLGEPMNLLGLLTGDLVTRAAKPPGSSP